MKKCLGFFLVVILGCLFWNNAVAEEGEILYNGIQLPKQWPPVIKGEGKGWERQIRPLSYLQAPPAVIPIDVGRQLFVDDFLIEKTDLKREFHQPQKYEGNPILKAETPIELHDGKEPMAAMISDGFCYDPKEKQFKLWYEAGWRDGTMLATSTDGLHFTRPNLDIEPGTNRILPKKANKMVRHGAGIALDHWTTDPDQRFKMVCYDENQDGPKKQGLTNAYTSPDGIHWKNLGYMSECGDNTTIFYNPFRKKWVFSIREDFYGRARFYREHSDFITGMNWEDSRALKTDSKTWDTSNMMVFWAHADELDTPDEWVVDTLARLRADPAVPKVREKDGKPYGLDDVQTQLYNVEAVAYESLMLGVFGVHRGPENHICSDLIKLPKTCDLQLAYSRDGFNWDRPDRNYFLKSTRKPGDWEHAYLHAGVGICTVVGDRLYFYYSGWSGVSPKLGTDWYSGGATGVAFLRRDGFASMNAKEKEGTLTTRPVTFKGKYLFANVNTPQGELRAEVLDENNKVIAPFSMENSVPSTTDKTRLKLGWKGGEDLGSLAGRKVKFRFQLKNGELYSFWVSPDLSGASYGYVAAGGPGFNGPIDTVGGP
ncbi:MAG: glycosyl hydrolase family 32 [Verrucomicrobiota bacterium]